MSNLRQNIPRLGAKFCISGLLGASQFWRRQPTSATSSGQSSGPRKIQKIHRWINGLQGKSGRNHGFCGEVMRVSDRFPLNQCQATRYVQVNIWYHIIKLQAATSITISNLWCTPGRGMIYSHKSPPHGWFLHGDSWLILLAGTFQSFIS